MSADVDAARAALLRYLDKPYPIHSDPPCDFWQGYETGLNVARAAVQRLNGNGFHEPSEPALEAALAAIDALREAER